MASSSSTNHHNLLSITILILGILSISSTTARPCKTLFISSYSITFKPTFHHDHNPNFIFLTKPLPSQQQSRRGFITFFTSSSSSSRIFIDGAGFPAENEFRQFRPLDEEEEAAFGLFQSLRDRTKDLISVVVALLFGVGCGALIASTMYLAWSMVSSCTRFDSDEIDADDYDFMAKKIGYVMIPSVDATLSKQVDIAIQPSINKD